MDVMNMRSFGKQLNDLTFTDYFLRLKLLAKSVFKWEGLPNGMDEKWIESFLFDRGKCVFYKDPLRGLMVAECAPNGDLNNYQEPTKVTPTGIDVNYANLTPGVDCVLILNNDLMLPTSFTLKLFAYRLAEISRTIDVNVGAQKTPVLVHTTNKQMLSLKNIYTQFSGNEPVIFGDKSFDPETMRVLKTDAPVVFPELQQQKIALWNECLTFLGINNANTEKRERLITDEVEANNDHIDLSAMCFLKARERACDEINRIFGTKISVTMRKEDHVECTQDIQNTSET